MVNKWLRSHLRSFGLVPAFVVTAGAAVGWPAPAAAQAISEFAVPTARSGLEAITPAPLNQTEMWFTESFVGKIGRISLAQTTGSQTSEFVVPGNPSQLLNSEPQFIVAGPDGALWFPDAGTNTIGRITTDGTVTNQFPIPTPASFARGIAVGPDGALWFTEKAKIGQITTGGTVTEFAIPTSNPGAGLIAAGPGGLWFTEPLANKIGLIAVSGAITEFPVPTANTPTGNSQPQGITLGPDGAMWFTEFLGDKIGRITQTGTITEFPFPPGKGEPLGITAGLDGNLWFSVEGTSGFGQITTSGTISFFPLSHANANVNSIATSPDGSLWITEQMSNQLAQLTPAASTSLLVAAVLPSSRSVQVGATATAFATMINAGTSAASNCAITPVTSVPASFVYQTTNPATNALTGTPNTPVNIAAGASQSFVIAFTATAPFAPNVVQLGFACSGITAAPTNPGLNTLLLSGSATPVPDIVALGATTQNDGILHITGTTGSGAFAVATVNVGASAAITATANTGSATLPLAISLCQTDPTSGQCLASPASSVSTTIAANATPTFAIFATASGAVPFSPATNRIFVQFSDASAVVRGSTSVAVQTQ